MSIFNTNLGTSIPFRELSVFRIYVQAHRFNVGISFFNFSIFSITKSRRKLYFIKCRLNRKNKNRSLHTSSETSL